MNDGLPRVSIIVPSFNHAPYIGKTIASIFDQDYSNKELIVIDDGSSDDSPELLKDLQHDHGFILVCRENRGLVATLREAVELSCGKYFAVIASDDMMWPDDRLTRQVRYLEQHPDTGVHGGGVVAVDEHGNRVKTRTYPDRRLDFADIILNRKHRPATPTMMVRREAYDAVGGYAADIKVEDSQILHKISHAGYAIDASSEALACYRTHDNNMHDNVPLLEEAAWKTIELFRDHPLYEKGRAAILNSYFVKYAQGDKSRAAELLKQIPLRYWNSKTLKGLFRLVFR